MTSDKSQFKKAENLDLGASSKIRQDMSQSNQESSTGYQISAKDSTVQITHNYPPISKKVIDVPLKRILLLSANSDEAEKGRREKEIFEIEAALDRAFLKLRKRDKEIQPLYESPLYPPNIGADNISQELSAVEPYVVDISGTEDSGLEGLTIGKSPKGGKVENANKLIADLFRINAEKIHCVILNRCYIEEQAREISQHINFLIGISQELEEDPIVGFLAEFYYSISIGKSVLQSYELGCGLINRNYHVCKDQFPVLLEKYKIRLEKKLTKLERELDKKPNNVELWESKGSLLNKLGCTEAANAAYEKASALAPENPEIREKQGDILEEAGNYKKAVLAYERALDLEEGDYRVWWKKGKAHVGAGQFSEAVESYSKALNRAPSDIYLIRSEYGYILQKVNKYEESLTQYKKTLQIEPRYRAASYERKWLYKKIYSRKSG
jgi:tetratricopeptide (TPR) repeat protein